jgi:replication factor C subunit 3/5
MSNTIPWVEKYRPKYLRDVVINDSNRNIFNNIIKKNYFPNMIVYGPPGCGKTTVCINLINEYQEKYSRVNNSNIIHLNASDERGIDIIRNQIHQFVKCNNLFEKGLKFIILDEVDYMTKNAQNALKHILQTSYTNIRFCLICNYITKIIETLKNEFMCIRFHQLPKTQILEFIKSICLHEDLYISDDIIYIIQEMFQSDIRSMINYVQLNENIFHKKTSTSIIKIINNSQLNTILLFPQNDTITLCTFLNHIHQTSIDYNIDKRSMLQKLLNYIIIHHSYLLNSTFFNTIEIMLHRQDIPYSIHYTTLYYLLQKKGNDIQRKKNNEINTLL